MESLRAIEQLYDRYAVVVYSLAFRIVGDRTAAEEILVEVFARAWRSGPAMPTAGSPALAWLVEVTRAVSLDMAPGSPVPESSTGRETSAKELHPEPEEERGVAAAFGAGRRLVLAALAALRPDRRRAIELAFFGGWTSREIAVALGVSEPTVNRWVTEAVTDLGVTTERLHRERAGTNRFGA